MESNLPPSKSVPSNLTTSRRHRVSISGSGSYQSHLSTLGNFHRARTTSEQISLSPLRPQKDYLQTLEDGLAEQRPRVGRLGLLKQFVTDPAAFFSDDLRRIRSGHVWRPRALFTLYCCLGVLFLTIKIHTLVLDAFHSHSSRSGPSIHDAHDTDVHHDGPPLMNISLAQRLHVTFRELAPQAHLATFVVHHPPPESHTLTACLWIDSAHIDSALQSASAYPGPVSLVIVTTYPPGSSGYDAVLSATVRASGNTCVHVLHVPSVDGGSANAYLNMARFFAQTSQVALFPDGIPEAHAHWGDVLLNLPVHSHPVLLRNSDASHRDKDKGWGLAPLLIPRDHPVWCTERYHLFGSRRLDWEECVWKMWLESAGDASFVNVPLVLEGDANVNSNAISVPPFAMKMRLRWSTKYRSEACAFALKRSQALGSLSRTEKRHMQWRKKFCRETVGQVGALGI